jgi:hypothetical protein
VVKVAFNTSKTFAAAVQPKDGRYTDRLTRMACSLPPPIWQRNEPRRAADTTAGLVKAVHPSEPGSSETMNKDLSIFMTPDT